MSKQQSSQVNPSSKLREIYNDLLVGKQQLEQRLQKPNEQGDKVNKKD